MCVVIINVHIMFLIIILRLKALKEKMNSNLDF